MRIPLGILAATLILQAGSAAAYEWQMGDGTNTFVVPAETTFADETLCTAYRISFQGTAQKDCWLGALSAVLFDGDSAGDLRIMAPSIILNGTARQNLMAYARGLQLTSNTVVRGQTALFGDTVICEGRCEGDAWILAQAVTLGGTWNGNLHVRAQEIRVVPGTAIAGDLIYSAPEPLILDSGVQLGGDLRKAENPLADAPGFSWQQLQGRLQLLGTLFLAALLTGMPFVGLFPMLAGRAVRQLTTSPWKVLLAGLGTVLLLPAAIAFVFMSVVGIPLAVLAGAFFLSMAYLGHIVVALWLGNRLLRRRGSQSFSRVLSTLGTGLFILYGLSAAPGVASLIALPITVLGAGSLVLAVFERPRITVAIPPPPPQKNQPDA